MNATATPDTGRWTPRRIAIWTAISLLGAVAWGILALEQRSGGRLHLDPARGR